MPKPKNTGLGRGLDAIFIDNTVEDSGNVTMLRLSEIEPNPDQPRREFDAESLAQLADSIATHGLIQPIVVRSAENDGYYQIIAGERRWRASKMAGLTEIPVIVMELDDKKAAQIALIENVQRENLNPMEEASAYKTLISDHKMTQEEIARQIGKSRSAVANTLRLLDLPDEVCELVKLGKLSSGHARTLLGLKSREDMITGANVIINKNFSVREAELMVRNMNKVALLREKLFSEAPEPTTVDYTSELAKKMTSRIGHKVTILKKGKNRKIEIHFTDDAELDDIVTRLCGNNIFDE